MIKFIQDKSVFITPFTTIEEAKAHIEEKGFNKKNFCVVIGEGDYWVVLKKNLPLLEKTPHKQV